MAKAVADDYLRRIPKAELHCHLAGTLRATTVAELAKKYGLPLPRPAEQLYQWPNFDGFLEILRLTASVLRTQEDFSRAIYEYCEDARRDGNLRRLDEHGGHLGSAADRVFMAGGRPPALDLGPRRRRLRRWLRADGRRRLQSRQPDRGLGWWLRRDLLLRADALILTAERTAIFFARFSCTFRT